jgi:hypothetical protein
MDEKSETPEIQKLKRTRRFRRLRCEFKAELAGRLGVKEGEQAQMSRADRVLIDQCALLSLRASKCATPSYLVRRK